MLFNFAETSPNLLELSQAPFFPSLSVLALN